jgi:hypothetical protein
LRGQDLNLRPSGYEPDELPGCSTPRAWALWGGGPEGLAATDSPATGVAVPWALGGFTAEFGMGSGAGPPPWPPGRPARPGIPGARGGRQGLARGARACVCRAAPAGRAGGGCCARGGSRAPRAIRTGRLRASPRLHPRPIDVLVSHGPRGGLVLRGASRLDAFSGYPARTWLPGGAAGATTGAPEVRPSRSSRTGDGASQVSFARGR